MLTLITLWPYKPWLTQATEGAPLAMTATPFATGGKLLHVGTRVINERTAWHSVGGFGWGTEVIELNGRRRTNIRKI